MRDDRMRLLTLRRVSKIVEILNVGQVVTTEEIRERVSLKMDRYFSKSTIEKDIYMLRHEFDIEIKQVRGATMKGLKISEEVDFLDKLKDFLK